MNLLKRLKPHYKELLEVKNQKYPTLVGQVSTILESNNDVLDLRYETVLDLNALFNSHSPFNYFN